MQLILNCTRPRVITYTNYGYNVIIMIVMIIFTIVIIMIVTIIVMIMILMMMMIIVTYLMTPYTLGVFSSVIVPIELE